MVLLGLCLGACAALQKGNKGRSAETAIVLDTMDYEIQAMALKPYQPTSERICDITHIELDVRFNLKEEEVIGTAKLWLTAYFNPIDTIELDARNFDLHEVTIAVNNDNYTPAYLYDKKVLKLPLKQPLSQGDTALLSIKYTAHPSEIEGNNGRAITGNRGLYFIDPRDEDPEKPTQIWTQGETEYNSGWFPVIDKPNEKYSQEVFITVDSSFVTLSNGKLVYSTENKDGTRTDYWKQEMPHSAYLTMVAAGDFAVVKDSWRGKDVWYYVDHSHKEFADEIFGNTPEMLSFYSDLLDYEYPWEKYHQIVVKDFVSGAMENTSAVVHGDFVQQTPREMLDGTHEDVIAHELFHHWFGDLVTTESWAQITMNEGFATYGEYLWQAHKYGFEEARFHLRQDLANYLNEAQDTPKTLVQDHYNEPDDVFDRHSYQKGGRVMHMLRNEIGDEAFFKTLNLYLRQNAFDNVEDAHLRLAAEKVTGRDLRWFFDQWFHREGHPIVAVNFQTDSLRNLNVLITQDASRFGIFKFHVDLQIGTSAGESRIKRLWVDDAESEFNIPLNADENWYVIDPNGDILWQMQEHKQADALFNQLQFAPTSHAKVAAMINDSVLSATYHKQYAEALQRIIESEPFWFTAGVAMSFLASSAHQDTAASIAIFQHQQMHSKNSEVRALALTLIDSLATDISIVHKAIETALNDSSLMVLRTALGLASTLDPCAYLAQVGRLDKDVYDNMVQYIARLHAHCGDIGSLEFFLTQGKSLQGVDRYLFNNEFDKYAAHVRTDEVYEAMVKEIAPSALDSFSWWTRLAAVQSLKNALAYYKMEVILLEAKDNLNPEEVIRLADLRNKKANVAAMIEEAEAIEADIND